MLKHAVCHLLMDWMFQHLLYKHRTVDIDKQLLASPLRRLTSHHTPIIVCLFWGLTWDLLGSYLGVIWELFGKYNAHIAVIIIRGHPERIPKTSRRNTI